MYSLAQKILIIVFLLKIYVIINYMGGSY